MTLPINIHRTFHRIQYASDSDLSVASWTSLPHGRRNDATQNALLSVPYNDAFSEIYILDTYSRRCLPNYGEATFHFDSGTFDGNVVFPLSLVGSVIRIQAAIAAEDSDDVLTAGSFDQLPWKTVWIGRVDQESDDPLTRRRTYYAFDLLFSELRRTMMNKHAYYIAGGPQIAVGHPGYNIGDGYDTRDRDASESDVDGIKSHILPGYDGTSSTTHWTAKDIVETILATTKKDGGNTYILSGGDPPAGAFTGSTEPDDILGNIVRQVRVNEQSSAWEVVTSVCDRRRSAGVCFFDFQTDADNPELYLKVQAQFPGILTVSVPSGGTRVIPGANAFGTSADFSVAGDQRLVGFKLDDRELWKADYLETIGDRIRVVVTLSTKTGTLSDGWPSALEAAYTAAVAAGDLESSSQRIADVYRRFQLPVDWNYVANNGVDTGAATPTRCDYRCDDDGSIITPANGDDVDTSPLIVRLDRDLPLKAGWDYSGSSPSPYDSGDTTQRPSPPLAYIYDSTAEDWYPPDGWNIRFGVRDVNVIEPNPYLRILEEANNDLVITASITLPHRVRFASGNNLSPRRRTILVPGMQLHLAHPLAIWSFDDETGAPKYGCAGGSGTTPGIIRDDRDGISVIHSMAEKWYLDDHVGIRLHVRGNGFVDWLDAEGNTNSWPKIGSVIKDFSFSQRDGAVFDGAKQQSTFTETLNTPVTSIVYNANSDTTDFTSDWSEMSV